MSLTPQSIRPSSHTQCTFSMRGGGSQTPASVQKGVINNDDLEELSVLHPHWWNIRGVSRASAALAPVNQSVVTSIRWHRWLSLSRDGSQYTNFLSSIWIRVGFFSELPRHYHLFSITLIFDRCHHNLAAVTPVKYECDSGILFCKIQNIPYREKSEWSFCELHPWIQVTEIQVNTLW